MGIKRFIKEGVRDLKKEAENMLFNMDCRGYVV